MFTGYDLTQDRLCWHFGSGNLQNDVTLQTLRDLVREMPITLTCSPLETLDFGGLAVGEERHVLLVSNCESRWFTKRDAIVAQACKTATRPTRYISWLRDGWIEPQTTTMARTDQVPIASLPSRGAHVLQLSAARIPVQLAANVSNATVVGQIDNRSEARYGVPMLILIGGDSAAAFECMVQIAPTYERVVWISSGDSPESLPDEIAFRYSRRDTDLAGVEYFELRALRPTALIEPACVSC